MAQRVQEIGSEEIIDEKKILKEAEEREKEIKKELKEAKEEAKKEAKKEAGVVEQKKQKKIKGSKKYLAVREKIDKSREYETDEAITAIKQSAITKFDSTVEVHIKLDKKQENIRGTLHFPGGVAKEKKVLVVSEKNVEAVVAEVKSGKINFDILIASPAVMPKLAVLAKVLGPRGLMPNPKAGTVSENPEEAAEEFKGGKVEYKADKGNVVHMVIGKVSFADEKIKENLEALTSVLTKNKIQSVYLTTTMGPSVRLVVGKQK